MTLNIIFKLLELKWDHSELMSSSLFLFDFVQSSSLAARGLEGLSLQPQLSTPHLLHWSWVESALLL